MGGGTKFSPISTEVWIGATGSWVWLKIDEVGGGTKFSPISTEVWTGATGSCVWYKVGWGTKFSWGTESADGYDDSKVTWSGKAYCCSDGCSLTSVGTCTYISLVLWLLCNTGSSLGSLVLLECSIDTMSSSVGSASFKGPSNWLITAEAARIVASSLLSELVSLFSSSYRA